MSTENQCPKIQKRPEEVNKTVRDMYLLAAAIHALAARSTGKHGPGLHAAADRLEEIAAEFDEATGFDTLTESYCQFMAKQADAVALAVHWHANDKAGLVRCRGLADLVEGLTDRVGVADSYFHADETEVMS